MLRNETYEIDKLKFKLRDPDDLDLEEDDKVQEFFKDFYASDKQTISGTATSEDLAGLFRVILIPKGKLPDGFSYKKVKRGVAAKIIADFFLNSVFSTVNIASSLKNSMIEQIRP